MKMTMVNSGSKGLTKDGHPMLYTCCASSETTIGQCLVHPQELYIFYIKVIGSITTHHPTGARHWHNVGPPSVTPPPSPHSWFSITWLLQGWIHHWIHCKPRMYVPNSRLVVGWHYFNWVMHQRNSPVLFKEFHHFFHSNTPIFSL